MTGHPYPYPTRFSLHQRQASAFNWQMLNVVLSTSLRQCSFSPESMLTSELANMLTCQQKPHLAYLPASNLPPPMAIFQASQHRALLGS